MLDISAVQQTSQTSDSKNKKQDIENSESQNKENSTEFEAEYAAIDTPNEADQKEDKNSAEAEDTVQKNEQKTTVEADQDVVKSNAEPDFGAKTKVAEEPQVEVALADTKKSKTDDVPTSKVDTGLATASSRVKAADPSQTTERTRDKAARPLTSDLAPNKVNPAAVEKSVQPPANKSAVETAVLTKAMQNSENTMIPSTETRRTEAVKLEPSVSQNITANASILSTAAQFTTKVRPVTAAPNLSKSEIRSLEPTAPTPESIPKLNSPNSTMPTIPVSGSPLVVKQLTATTKDGSEIVQLTATDLDSSASWDTRSTSVSSAPGLAQALARTETPTLIARQMTEAMQRMPDRPVEISLNPQELGRVKMSISAAEAGITVTVLAERPETLDLMRRHIDQLGREFQAIGYENINFAFSGGASDQSHGQEREDHPSALQLNLETESVDNIPDANSIPLNTSEMTGLDIRL